MSKHTPGPWVAENVNDMTARVVSTSDDSVVAVVSGDGKSFEEMMANAELIAKALRLSEAIDKVKEGVDYINWHDRESAEGSRLRTSFDKIRAALGGE